MTRTALSIVVTGNIGSGKSSVVPLLASALGVPAYLERPGENPFFALGERALFQSQIWFLTAAVVDARRLELPAGGVQERCPQEHVSVFARGYHTLERLEAHELRLVELVHAVASGETRPPDHLIHLEAPDQVLLHRIRKRGRVEEAHTTAEFIDLLRALYEEFLAGWELSPVTRINTDIPYEEYDRLVKTVTDCLRRRR